MEPPFLVLRDGKKILASVPIALLFQLQRQARRLMWGAIVRGDSASKQQVEAIFSVLEPSDGRAIIMALIMQDAAEEAVEGRDAMLAQRQAEQAYAQQAAQQAAQQVQGEPKSKDGAGGGGPAKAGAKPKSENDYFCVHGCPTDIACADCEALIAKSAGRAA